MSFAIQMYRCISDQRYVTKSLTTKGYILYNNSRGEFDVVNPVFVIQTDSYNPQDQSSISIYNVGGNYYGDDLFKRDILSGEINYFSINFGDVNNPFIRYYYILSANYIQNNLLEINCHEDVLMTFRNEIRSFDGIVRRNENSYNLYIKDEKIGVYEKPIVRQKVFSNGFTNNSSNVTYLLTTVGKRPKTVTGNPLNIASFTCNGFNSQFASNGGEFIWLPYAYCDVVSHTNSRYYSDFKLSPFEDWVICNKGAVYLGDTPGWCVAQIINYDANANTIELSILENFNWGETLNVFTELNSSEFKAYCWSIGGIISGQSFGTSLDINGATYTTGDYRGYRNALPVTLNSFSNHQASNTVRFYCQY